jgi:hypothetical protein
MREVSVHWWSTRGSLVGALLNASALSLIFHRLVVLEVPSLNDLIAVPMDSIIVLAVVWAVKEGSQSKDRAVRFLQTAFTGWFWPLIPLLAFGLTFLPMVTVHCDEDGTLQVSRVDGQGQIRSLTCRQGTIQSETFSGLSPEIVTVDNSDLRETRRALRPFAGNAIRFPSDFVDPLQALVTLDSTSAASVAESTRPETEITRGCDVRESLFCISLEGIGEYPLGRRPLLIGGRAMRPGLRAAWQEFAPRDGLSSRPPFIQTRPTLLHHGQNVLVRVTKYDTSKGRFTACRRAAKFTPWRGDGNVWKIEAQELCS